MRKTSMAMLCLVLSSVALADERFASSVVDFGGLGTNSFYNDPNAILGKPTRWNRDTFNGGPLDRVATSLVYGPWQLDDQDQKVICTIPTGGFVTVKFDTPIVNDPNNLFGLDFIVYGNAFFSPNGAVAWNTNMENLTISGSGIFSEPTTVSVSPDNVSWFTYASPTADNYWPTQAFAWDRAADNWGSELNWTQPVSPSLLPSQFAGISVADAIDLYAGSAGGTAFDLAPSGFGQISYIRFTGSGGEIDAVARVSAVPEPASMLALAAGLAALTRMRRRRI